jgi:hypothetical protein
VLALLAAAALTCVAAEVIGQGVCWVCGARRATFVAAPAGLALLMAAGLLAPHLPGRTWGSLVLIAIAFAGGVVVLVREPQSRPGAGDVLALAPAVVLVLIPFLTAGHAGTLGVSVDNDMATHLRIAEAYRSSSVAAISPIDPSYPTGPHALVAMLATVLGARVDYVFAGVTMATPVLLAWTAFGSLRRVPWLGRAYVGAMAGVPFLVAAFYSEGAFKEVMQALFVLAFATELQLLVGNPDRSAAPAPEQEGRLRSPVDPRLVRWVPAALLIAGSLSVYSVSGLAWLLAGGALTIAVTCLHLPSRSEPLGASREQLRAAVVPATIALVALLIVLIPEIPRLVRFYERTKGGTGIAISNLGNLVGPVSPWQALGIWKNPDFRLPTNDPLHTGMWLALGFALTLIGFVWWWRRGDRAVPVMALVSFAIWIYADHRQSPYVAAKALVVLSPMLLLIATRPLVERAPWEPRLRWLGALRVALAVVFGWIVLHTSVNALRYATVGSTAHVDELRSIQPLLGRSQTLFLAYDDYVAWELAGTPVSAVVIGGAQQFHERPEKAWSYGQPFDFDFVPSADLEKFTYVILPRGLSGSQPPSNFKLVRAGQYYDVFQRVGPTVPREVLAEGPEPGGGFDCTSPYGRMLLRKGGVAAVRQPNVDVAVPLMAPGQSTSVRLPLTPGRWFLSAPYTSEYPVTVTGPGLSTVLPANQDRPGARWPIGPIVVRGPGGAVVTIHAHTTDLALPTQLTVMSAIIATPEVPIRVVPLREACGRYVDWYRTF